MCLMDAIALNFSVLRAFENDFWKLGAPTPFFILIISTATLMLFQYCYLSNFDKFNMILLKY